MNYRDFFKEDMMPGGKGDSANPHNFDPSEFELGMSVEREHTNDEKLAAEIAKDHLTEDPHYYSKLEKAGLTDQPTEPTFSDDESNVDSANAVNEPPVRSVKKQTADITVYPKVDGDPSKGPDMVGSIGSTKDIDTNGATDVESIATDPTPTDHITGGMNGTPSNPNILSKDSDQSDGGEGLVKAMMKTAEIPQDIAIDIAESKKILRKMKEGMVPAAGDPSNDPKYVKGKRWTVKW
jgi:hypothetical protein